MEELRDAVVQLSFTVVARLTQAGVAHDLSLTQLRLLAILADREPRLADLAEHLGLDRSTVSGLVDRAGARGLVERSPDPDDGRASRVRITATGRELAAVVETELAPWFTELFGALSAPERRTTAGLLARLLAR